MAALRDRHLVQQQPYSESLVKKYFSKLRKLVTWKCGTTPFSEIIENYSGSKKQRYRRAYGYLSKHGLQPKHTRVQMFIKPDRFPLSMVSVKPPRAIQFRSPEFNLMMAHYLKKFEEVTYQNLKIGNSKTRNIMKGLNPRARARVFLEKTRSFKNPVFLCLDHSRFDSCIQPLHLKETHKIYMKSVGKRVYNIVKHQVTNLGYSKHGLKYRTSGTRMSGDFDTGLGNCLVNIASILSVVGKVKCDFILDGDDAVIITEKEDINKLKINNFAHFGLITKLNLQQEISRVEFCQSRIIFNKGPIFSRNPIRALSHSMISRKYYNTKTVCEYLRGVGECEESVSYGVPILHKLSQILQLASPKAFYDSDMEWRMAQGQDMEKVEITSEARMSFYIAWGITPQHQELLEASLIPPSLRIACPKDRQSRRLRNPEFHYDVKSLYESWTRMESLGSDGSANWWFIDQRWA